MSERKKGPTLEDWIAAFDNAPGCHHPSPTLEVMKPEDTPDIAINVMARLAVNDLDNEMQLIAEIDEITDDPESDEQA